ncbi:MAG TPA: 50S ribosomal protein L6, partial [Geobacterales bacterium]|nr:50S ribosomal protein L6 [Geobacterales bacterium]
SRTLTSEVEVNVATKEILVSRANDELSARGMHGLTRTLISNMVVGVTNGFEKALEITGVGYRAEAKGSVLNLSLGYSHPINFELPKGITVEVEKQTRIVVKGIDKELVGQTAAKIRDFRGPEPYKGKGIRYAGEVILRKAGKTGKK